MLLPVQTKKALYFTNHIARLMKVFGHNTMKLWYGTDKIAMVTNDNMISLALFVSSEVIHITIITIVLVLEIPTRLSLCFGQLMI